MVVSTLLFAACKREKLDVAIEERAGVGQGSAVRFVNIGGYRHVIGNGDTLTNRREDKRPTRYFPKDGLLGQTWYVPTSLFGDRGRVDFTVTDGQGHAVSFSVPAPGNAKVDYYTLRPEGAGQAWAVPVAREETGPARPDHFKIRIVNLTKVMPPLVPGGFTGAMESLAGPLTLAFADGRPVDPKTTNVGVAQVASDYAELPYGTFQFRVLTADGRQVACAHHGVNAPAVRIMDPASSRMTATRSPIPTGLTYSPIETFQPGGVYTIVVSPFAFAYYTPPNVDNLALGYQNQFVVIEDVAPNPNLSFSKVQGVNALPGERVVFRINGERLAAVPSFGDATDYRIVDAGTLSVEALGAGNRVLAQVEFSIRANQNVSCWLWRKQDGTLDLLPVFNDLSTDFYVERFTDNGTVNRYEHTMAVGTRYLNLCPDLPFATFTINNGQDMRGYGVLSAKGAGHYVVHPDGTMENLSPGVPATDLPYVRWQPDNSMVFHWMIYQSRPGVTPGVWQAGIPTFDSYNLIQNPQLYQRIDRDLPTIEPGVYTLALIGRVADGIAESERARIVAVKHNR